MSNGWWQLKSLANVLSWQEDAINFHDDLLGSTKKDEHQILRTLRNSSSYLWPPNFWLRGERSKTCSWNYETFCTWRYFIFPSKPFRKENIKRFHSGHHVWWVIHYWLRVLSKIRWSNNSWPWSNKTEKLLFCKFILNL